MADDEASASDNDTSCQLPALKMPEVFDFSNLSYDQRLDDLYDKLTDVKPAEVHSAFMCHIDEAGDSLRGRQAVWRSLDLACDILVEMKRVGNTFPIMVEVELVEPFYCQPSSSTLGGAIMQEQIASYLRYHWNEVDVVELFPVHDESGELDAAALAIEQTRFFYDYIWRFSDENDCGDYYFAPSHLKPRLKLYYDAADKKVSPGLALKYHDTISEYQTKLRLLRKKQALFDSDDDDDDYSDDDNNTGSDTEKSNGDNDSQKDKDHDKDSDVDGESDDEDGATVEKRRRMNELDAIEMTRLWKDIALLEKNLEVLEHPVMRYLTESSSGRKRKRSSVAGMQQMRLHKEPVTHLVAEKITLGMIEHLQLPLDTVVQSYTTPASALASCYNNDKVFIFPGRYSGEGFSFLKVSVTIQGVGKPEDVTIVNHLGSAEIHNPFIGCHAGNISITNLTFLDESGTKKGGGGRRRKRSSGSDDPRLGGILRVSWGTANISNCRFICSSTGLTVEDCGLSMDNCEISGAQGPGVSLYSGSKVNIKTCYIHDCGKKPPAASSQEMCGVFIMSPQSLENERSKVSTSVKIRACRIQRNTGPALHLQIYSPEKQQEAEVIDLDDLCTLTCRDLRVSDSDLSGNDKGVAMVSWTKFIFVKSSPSPKQPLLLSS